MRTGFQEAEACLRSAGSSMENSDIVKVCSRFMKGWQERQYRIWRWDALKMRKDLGRLSVVTQLPRRTRLVRQFQSVSYTQDLPFAAIAVISGGLQLFYI